MKIQSVIIPKSKFTKEQACQWIEDHGFKISFDEKTGPDITLNFFRFRQMATDKNVHYYIRRLSNGINLVLFDK